MGLKLYRRLYLDIRLLCSQMFTASFLKQFGDSIIIQELLTITNLEVFNITKVLIGEITNPEKSLLIACEKGYSKIAKQIFPFVQSDFFTKTLEDGETFLMKSARTCPQLIDLIISAGADKTIGLQNNRGWTALMVAAECHPEAVQA